MTDREITSYFTGQGVTGICTLTRIRLHMYRYGLERASQNRVLACNRVYRITNFASEQASAFPDYTYRCNAV